MFNIKQTEAFRIWLAAIKDGPSQRRLLARLHKASFGLMGDVQPVGDGVMKCGNISDPAGACAFA